MINENKNREQIGVNKTVRVVCSQPEKVCIYVRKSNFSDNDIAKRTKRWKKRFVEGILKQNTKDQEKLGMIKREMLGTILFCYLRSTYSFEEEIVPVENVILKTEEYLLQETENLREYGVEAEVVKSLLEEFERIKNQVKHWMTKEQKELLRKD